MAHRRDSAFAVICRRKQVLLVKPKGSKRWQLPGGGVKSDETPWNAALREVQEETGLDAKLVALTGVYPRHDRSLAFVFVARVGWQRIPKGQLNEISKRKWMPFRKALRRLPRSARFRFLDAIRRKSIDALHISAG